MQHLGKGLGSLTYNICPANFEQNHIKMSITILQWLQNITYLLQIYFNEHK